MGKHENGPLTHEPRVTSLRQPSVAKKCGKGEDEGGREIILVSRQLSTSWINLSSNLATTAGNQSRKNNCWFLSGAGFYFWYTSQTKMSKSSIFSVRNSCGDYYTCQGVWRPKNCALHSCLSLPWLGQDAAGCPHSWDLRDLSISWLKNQQIKLETLAMLITFQFLPERAVWEVLTLCCSWQFYCFWLNLSYHKLQQIKINFPKLNL